MAYKSDEFTYSLTDKNYTCEGSYIYDFKRFVDLTNKDIMIVDHSFSREWFTHPLMKLQLVNYYQTKENQLENNADINLEKAYYYSILISTDITEANNPYGRFGQPKHLYSGVHKKLQFQLVDSYSVMITDGKGIRYNPLECNYPFKIQFKIIDKILINEDNIKED